MKYSFVLGNLGNTCDRFLSNGYKDQPSKQEMVRQVSSIPGVILLFSLRGEGSGCCGLRFASVLRTAFSALRIPHAEEAALAGFPLHPLCLTHHNARSRGLRSVLSPSFPRTGCGVRGPRPMTTAAPQTTLGESITTSLPVLFICAGCSRVSSLPPTDLCPERYQHPPAGVPRPLQQLCRAV